MRQQSPANRPEQSECASAEQEQARGLWDRAADAREREDRRFIHRRVLAAGKSKDRGRRCEGGTDLHTVVRDRAVLPTLNLRRDIEID